MSLPTSITPADGSASRRVWAFGALLLIAVIVAYANSLRGPFVYDDVSAISENESIRRLWRIDRVMMPPADTTVSGRPVLNGSFALNYAISGDAVWSYHVLNVLVHAAATLALFGLVRRTLDLGNAGASRRASGDSRLVRSGAWVAREHAASTWIAAVIALAWGLHPLNTEAVDYVVQRAESLMSLWLLLTLYCFARATTSAAAANAAQRLSGLWLPASAGCCLAGMATKENMAAAPLLVLLYDRTFVTGSLRAAWQQRSRFYVALAATWLALAALVVSTGGNRSGTVGVGTGISPVSYWLTQPSALLRYLSLSAWPNPLVFDYGTPWVSSAATVIAPALVVAALAALTVRSLRKNAPAGFLGLGCFAILAPTSVMPGVAQIIVEHRMYLPLAALITLALAAVWRQLGRRTLVIAGLAVPALLILTAARNRVYGDDARLWRDTGAKRPDNARVYFNLADIEVREHRLPEAIALYRKAIELYPEYTVARNNLGNALCQLGRFDEAVAEYRIVVQHSPRLAGANYNLGNALNAAGHLPEALPFYERAVQLAPENRDAQLNLAGAYMQEQRWPEAIRHFEAALALDPERADAHAALAECLARAGQSADSFPHFEFAIRRDPRNAELRAIYGNALADAKRLHDALVQFHTAAELAPDSVLVHYNYAATLLSAGRTAEAIEHFEIALRLKPDFAPARDALAQLRGP